MPEVPNVGYKVGELQANYTINELNKGQKGIYKLNPGENLVMINGDIKDPNTHFIAKGWFDRLDTSFKNKKLNLIFPTDGDIKNPEYFIDNWDGEKAAQKVKELLKNYQDNIQIVLVAKDGMANKIIGILGDKIRKILITGQDGSAQSARNIVENHQGITIYKPSKLLAEKTVELVVALSNGEDTQYLITTKDIKTTNGNIIPSHLLAPIPITKEDLKILTEDGIITPEQLCQGIKETCP